jgi:hypothetical protein
MWLRRYARVGPEQRRFLYQSGKALLSIFLLFAQQLAGAIFLYLL